MIFCTLFNSLYLDKGIVLYQSLEKYTPDLKLYVLCMDEKCYDVLEDLSFPHLIPIRLSDMEGEELLAVKSKRSFGEYCWTCTSWCIDYVLKTYNEEYCTYIDADMAFYSDPTVVLDEMKAANASVQVTLHRFVKYEAKRSEKKVGKYCVEFNTFKNDANGRMLLNLWKYQCLTKCTIKDKSGRYWGDQKYLNYWTEDYPFVVSTGNIGVGVAPWNIKMYDTIANGDKIYLKEKGSIIPIVCYHFEGITYITEDTINVHAIGCWSKKHDKMAIEYLYKPYLKELQKIRTLLKDKYGVDTFIKHHPVVGKVTIMGKIKYIMKIFLETRFVPYLLRYKIPDFLFHNRNIVKL